MKRTIAILSAICLLASCVKDIGTLSGNEDLVTMDFQAVFDEEAQTRAALSGSSSDAVRSLVWAADDSIMVSNGLSVAKFFNSSASASANAVFKGQIASGKEYYAAYPYGRSVSFSGGAFSLEIPQSQKYYPDGVDPKALLMVAKGVDGEFRFKNVCGIVVVNVKGEGEVKSLTFSAVGADGKAMKIAGKGKVMMNYANAPTLVMDESAGSSVTLNCLDENGNGVQLTESGTSFHFVLPAGQYSSFTVRVRLKDDSMKKTSANPMTVKRSERTTMSVIPFESSGSDLSSNGTANCYLVTSLGEHTFDATVKGNSDELVGNAVSAKVLWSTLLTNNAPSADEVISDVVLEGGDVMFNANKNGNAGIAVLDADGNILWSWHIWIIEGYDAHASSHLYYNGAGIFMDRNLGALVAEASEDNTSRGFQYQWGRKDPFDGYNYYITQGYVFNWTNSDDFIKEKPGIEYTVRNPMKHIEAYWGEDYSIVRGDWLYNQTVDRKQVDTLRWAGVKTKYDPCPPGWKVPGVSFSRLGVGVGPLPELPSDAQGRNFSGIFGDSPMIWYPFVRYWTSHASTNSFYTGTNHRIETSASSISADVGYLNTYNLSLNGLSFIRCCDERGVPMIGHSGITDITTTSASCYVEIAGDGGFDITDTGVIISRYNWYLDDNNIIKNINERPDDITIISKGVNKESFTAELSGLRSNVTYYVRPYAVNQIGYGFGDIVSFKTDMGGGNEDLGRGDDIVW